MLDFFELSNELMCFADRRGYFTRVNSAWTKSLGWSAEELCAKPFIEFVHPDDVEKTIREASLLTSSNYETAQFENRYQCRDGSYRTLSWKAVFGTDAEQIFAAARDVTEERRQAEELRAAEERFRTLAGNAPIGIARADATASIFYVNKRWCEQAGITEREAIGFGWHDLVHPDDLPGEAAKVEHAIRTGEDVLPHEFRFVHSNGSVRWGLVAISPLKGAASEVTGLIGIVEDITDRKEAELALHASREQFRAFMENTPTIAWAKDEQGKIVYLNRAGEERFGMPPGDWRGKTDFDYWPEPLARRLQDNDRKVLEAGAPLKFFEQTESGVQPRAFWMTILFPYGDGRGNRFVGGLAVDITDIKNAELEMHAKQELMRSLLAVQEKEKQQISYEFHDGLIQYATGALMFLERQKIAHPQADHALIDEAIAGLRTGIDDGRRVIRGLHPTAIDDSGLPAAIDDLIDQHASWKIAIEFHHAPDFGRLPLKIEAALYRIAQEAISNARKYSHSPRVEITLKRTPQEATIEVRDLGVGFVPSQVRKDGFGLRGMVERARLLNGDCEITSVLGQGTLVRAHIPIPDDDE